VRLALGIANDLSVVEAGEEAYPDGQMSRSPAISATERKFCS